MSDYRVEADDNLKTALNYPNGYQHLRTEDLIALAQVNATLEVAAQLRIANLIAVREVIVSPSLDLSSMSATQVETMLDVELQVNEGLGL